MNIIWYKDANGQNHYVKSFNGNAIVFTTDVNEAHEFTDQQINAIKTFIVNHENVNADDIHSGPKPPHL